MIVPELPEEIRVLKEAVGRFIEEEVYPLETRIAERGSIDYGEVDVVRRKAREAGFSMLNMPAEVGGRDLSMLGQVALEEESGKATNGLGFAVVDRGPRELYEIATPEQIAGRFFLRRRNVDGGECAGAIEDRELPGVAAIRLDAIAGAPRDQRRGDDVTGDRMRREGALQLEAARPGFVATGDGALSFHALDETLNRRNVRRQRMQRRRPVPRQQDRRHRRGRVLIERNDGSRLHHDRPPLYAALR